MNTQTQIAVGIIMLVLTLIGAGIMFFAKDWLWDRHEAAMRGRGIVNLERTPEWENQQNISGIALIFFAILILFVLTR